MDLPKNMPMDQLTSLVDILSSKLTGSTSGEIKAVNGNLTEKVIDAAIFVGLIKEQNGKYIVTESGKKFFQSQEQRGKNDAIRELLKNIDIYNITIEYLHHNKIEKPTKLDVGSYWSNNFSIKIKGLNEEDLTSTIIFFLKFLELASLGKFINAGRGRETRIDLDMVELAKYVTTNYSLSNPQQTEVKGAQRVDKKIPPTDVNKLAEDCVGGIFGVLWKITKFRPCYWGRLCSGHNLRQAPARFRFSLFGRVMLKLIFLFFGFLFF